MKTNNNRFCAFLRGVNVKGTNMKMAEVCTVFEKAGFQNVSSVLASGNILFSSDLQKDQIKKLLETAMSAYFNYEAFLFVKDQDEVHKIWSNNPFAALPDFHVYTFVGREQIEETMLAEFEKCEKEIGEEAKVVEGNFYWKVPKGNTLGSPFGKILGRKNLKDAFTSRNINTLEKVLKK